MKRGLLGIIILVLISVVSCGGNKFVTAQSELIKQSNAEILDYAARDAAAQIVTIPLIKQNKKYVVMSTEDVNAKDNALNALVEDSLISTLAKGGFIVLERDKDVLLRLAYQEGNNNLKSIMLPPATKKNDATTTLPKYDLNYGKNAQIVPTKIDNQTGSEVLASSDFVLSYRILESGVKYFQVEERAEDGSRQIKRKALVKLSVRIIDSKSGQIIWSDSLSGVEEDIVPKWQVQILEKTGYEFYPYTMPLQTKLNNSSK
jgi:curli biogenesis system outer membrane secretion channel CsgG